MSVTARVLRGAVLAAMPLLLAACASGAPRRDAPSRVTARLEVQNNLLPPRGVTIRAISTGGPRAILGVVASGRTTVLEYQQPGFQGTYYFTAEVDGGATMRSSNITLRDGARWVWTLQTNSLRAAE